MKRLSIGVATCAIAPDLDEDGPVLLATLSAVGARALPGVWDDPRVPWGSFDVVLVRSTWDYPLRRDAFLEWALICRRTANPYEVLVWNTDKRYLADLADAGVPTVFVQPGEPMPEQNGDCVIKPTVSGSAADTGRFPRTDDGAAAALVERLHSQGRTAMVQPYLPGIDVDGETSMVFLGGTYSHAVRREPLLTDSGPSPCRGRRRPEHNSSGKAVEGAA